MELKDIKQQFFAYRNGMLADRLRSAGDVHKTIFGLNLPQIVQIAQLVGTNAELAEQLWANDTNRESRLIAPMIYPVESFSKERAQAWIASVENTEVADILCHRLLRYTDYAEDLYQELSHESSELVRYVALRLALNLLLSGRIRNKEILSEIAETEKRNGSILSSEIVASILEEFE